MISDAQLIHESLTEAKRCLDMGRCNDAEAAYRRALQIAPGHAGALHNLGVLQAARSDHRAAISCFDAAIASVPSYASAHYNRGVALVALADRRGAIEAFLRTVALAPDHYEAHRALGFLWLEDGHRGRALDHFAWTRELRRGENRTGLAAKSLSHANRAKLLHDAAQFEYLGRAGPGLGRFEKLARSYALAAEMSPAAVGPLSPAQWELVGEDYNADIHGVGAPETAGTALGGRPDRDGLLKRWRECGAVYFDDFLTSAALAALRRHLLESTIWHDFGHIPGHVASYLEDGLASPLLLQVADELRDLIPEVLGDKPLSQAWAFRSVEAVGAIEAHSDDADVSINFWLTPDEANLDPAHGGMQLCLAVPPADWKVTGYEDDRRRTMDFLRHHRGEMLRVRYRQNRAVLFNSRLVHFSDAPRFGDDYESRRLNVTMLFGRGGA